VTHLWPSGNDEDEEEDDEDRVLSNVGSGAEGAE